MEMAVGGVMVQQKKSAADELPTAGMIFRVDILYPHYNAYIQVFRSTNLKRQVTFLITYMVVAAAQRQTALPVLAHCQPFPSWPYLASIHMSGA